MITHFLTQALADDDFETVHKYVDQLLAAAKKHISIDLCPSGAWFVDHEKLHQFSLGVTPFWEMQDGIDVQLINDEGEPVYTCVIPFPVTGDVSRDAVFYVTLVAPLLDRLALLVQGLNNETRRTEEDMVARLRNALQHLHDADTLAGPDGTDICDESGPVGVLELRQLADTIESQAASIERLRARVAEYAYARGTGPDR